jgi:hypothetical protein
LLPEEKRKGKGGESKNLLFFREYSKGLAVFHERTNPTQPVKDWRFPQIFESHG